MENQRVLERILLDDQRVITKLYKDCRGDFLSFISQRFNISPEESQDFYQESFYSMYRNIKGGKLLTLNCQLKTYLFSIGRNLVYNELRKKGRQTTEIESGYSEEIIDLTSVEEDNNQTIKLSIISELIDNMEEPCKTIIKLFYWKKLKLGKILVHIRGYSNTDALKTKKYKCMKQLEESLKNNLIAAGLN